MKRLTKIKGKKWFKRIFVTTGVLVTLAVSALLTFFKTDAFAATRDSWVQTAMSTSNHKWLATTFLSDSEIDSILDKYTVTNTTNSDNSTVNLSSDKSSSANSDNTSIKNISGSTYKGYVVTIKDPTSVQLINTLTDSGGGTKLSETVKKDNLSIAMNAAGFSFNRQTETTRDQALDSLTIMDGKLLYGDKSETYQMIGMSKDGKLMLGNYTYQEAIDAGIDDAISFGPYLIVNGENQITEESTGGYQPRTAIGQAEDGTIYFVVIEGRSSDSLGATLYDLQDIMKDLGAVNATNLDGGGSSELYYDGKLVNNLSNGSERSLPNAFVVSK